MSILGNPILMGGNGGGGGGNIQPLSVTQNGTYTASGGVDGYSPVSVNVPGGGSTNVLSGTSAPTAAQGSNGAIYLQTSSILNVDNFTKLYDTSKPYGNYGTKVAARLAINDESSHSALQSRGWEANGMSYYDSEYQIGAYAGYSFGQALYLSKVKLWLGRYSAQNNTLYATVQYLDGNDDWNDVETIPITTSLSYPSCITEVTLDSTIPIYGIRWIHKNSPYKTSGNNITFAGMTVYGVIGSIISSTYAKVNEAWQDLIGTDINDINLGGAADCWWRVRYYSKSGSALIHTEYVQNGGDAEYGEGESWATVPNGEAVSGILEGVSGNLDVYSTRTLAVRLSTRTTSNASLNIEIGTYDLTTGTFTTSASSYIVWNDSRVLTYSASIPASPYVLNGLLSLWYYETGSGATATWRTAAYTDTVYGDQTYSAGTQITNWTSVTNKSGLLFYQA